MLNGFIIYVCIKCILYYTHGRGNLVTQHNKINLKKIVFFVVYW